MKVIEQWDGIRYSFMIVSDDTEKYMLLAKDRLYGQDRMIPAYDYIQCRFIAHGLEYDRPVDEVCI